MQCAQRHVATVLQDDLRLAAGIDDAVVVGVFLARVRVVSAVVAPVTDAVAVRVLLARIVEVGAVVEKVQV